MEKVIKYRCEHCGDLFDSYKECFEHEDKHKRVNKANQMLKDGYTLGEIQDECSIWHKVPDHLKNVTMENCFIVRHWQCCDKPAYQIDRIYMNGRVRLWGCGSWYGYYGDDVRLDFMYLENPRPKEELYNYNS